MEEIPSKLELALQHISHLTLAEYCQITGRKADQWEPVLISASRYFDGSLRDSDLDAVLEIMYGKMERLGISDAIKLEIRESPESYQYGGSKNIVAYAVGLKFKGEA